MSDMKHNDKRCEQNALSSLILIQVVEIVSTTALKDQKRNVKMIM
jgi:hypothetical protein